MSDQMRERARATVLSFPQCPTYCDCVGYCSRKADAILSALVETAEAERAACEAIAREGWSIDVADAIATRASKSPT